MWEERTRGWGRIASTNKFLQKTKISVVVLQPGKSVGLTCPVPRSTFSDPSLRLLSVLIAAHEQHQATANTAGPGET